VLVVGDGLFKAFPLLHHLLAALRLIPKIRG